MKNIKTNPELISYQELRIIIGFIGLLLPLILIIGHSIALKTLTVERSISYYYYTNMGDVFVGLLCGVGLFLFTYKGHPKDKSDYISDNLAGNLAALFAFGVAFFPTDSSKTGLWHNIFAFSFFVMLAVFCLYLFTKSKGEMTLMKRYRNNVYRICGCIIIVCLLLLLVNHLLKLDSELHFPSFILVVEVVALWAFAASWLVKGEMLLGD